MTSPPTIVLLLERQRVPWGVPSNAIGDPPSPLWAEYPVNVLLQWAIRMGWSEALRQGEDQVRERWARLRKMDLRQRKDS